MAMKLEDKKTFVKEINAVAGESISADCCRDDGIAQGCSQCRCVFACC
jgi:hypothetical protein